MNLLLNLLQVSLASLPPTVSLLTSLTLSVKPFLRLRPVGLRLQRCMQRRSLSISVGGCPVGKRGARRHGVLFQSTFLCLCHWLFLSTCIQACVDICVCLPVPVGVCLLPPVLCYLLAPVAVSLHYRTTWECCRCQRTKWAKQQQLMRPYSTDFYKHLECASHGAVRAFSPRQAPATAHREQIPTP